MNEKKIVLHLITGLNLGGAEQALAANLPLLDNFDNIICCLSSGGELTEQLRQKGFRVEELKSGKWSSPAAVWRFYKLVKKLKPDLLVTYLIHADMFGRIWGHAFGVKKIVCSLRSALYGSKYELVFLAERLTGRLVAQYIAVSQSVKNAYVLKAGISAEKILVIPNGINLAKFSAGTNFKPEYGLAEDDLVITCVAQLRPEKNHLLLIKSFANFQKTIPKSALLLVGEGPERQTIENEVTRQNLTGRVRLLGQRADVPQILGSSDIFILLSSFEGMSNAILEAMAAGCPVIASDIDPNRELVEQEKNGLLVPLKPMAVSKSLMDLANNPALRQNMRENNLAKARNFSLVNTAGQFSGALQELILK